MAKSKKATEQTQKNLVPDNAIETTEAKRVHCPDPDAPTHLGGEDKELKGKLLIEISRTVCKHCNSRGRFVVYSTEDRSRYLKCTACGRTGHKIVI